MRRREAADAEAAGTPPRNLMSYDPPTLNAVEWEAGFEKWRAGRARWARGHGADPADLPVAYISDAPFDPSTV